MKRILRVFPRQTHHTPLDDLVAFGPPGLFVPEHDEVHVSCAFTWDKQRAQKLAEAWYGKAPVKIGGPAFDDPGGAFVPGLYVKRGITITSRGCPNKCKFCFVPKREGLIRELEVMPGNIVQDNNLLACSKVHRRKVYEMLRTQKNIELVGGLEVGRLTDWDIEEMRNLRIGKLWLACDTHGAINRTVKAIQQLTAAGFNQNQIRCYVLIGDNMSENQERLETIYNAGALPFAQLFQPEERIEYSKEWKDFTRIWSRPAIYKGVMNAKKSV